MLKNLLHIVFALFFSTNLLAQINVSQNNNATQLAQNLAGVGVSISNATFSGSNVSSGTFTNAPNNLGISEGVVLTTGSVLSNGFDVGIAGQILDSPSSSNNTPGDSDLDNVTAVLGENFATLDATVLEFDIVVLGDSLVFNYAFGSEEYPDNSMFGSNYVCSQFGDVFGFFISGPDPSGGNYNNKNIALIPNTNTPITINTINNGVSSGGNANTCILTNTAFFNGPINGLTYNGFTNVFEAIARTTPCETYHIKLAIADGDGTSGDNTLDSGVFLEAASFSSIGTTLSGTTSNVIQNNTAIEGCLTANFEFNIPSPLNTNFVIDYLVGGSATNGSDYTIITNQITIPAGQTSAILNILPLEDNVVEGTEDITVYLMHPCFASTPIDSATISILDNINPNIVPLNDTTICKNSTLQVFGTGGNQYLWSPATIFSNAAIASPILSTNTPQNIIVEVFDVNNCSSFDTFHLDFHPEIIASAGDDTSVCLNVNDAVVFNTSVPLMASGGISYLWSPSSGLSSTITANTIASPSISTNYIVEITGVNGCKDSDTVWIDVLNPSIDLIQITTDSICLGDTVYVNVEDQGVITNYNWNPSGFVTNANEREPGFFPFTNTSYELSVENYCYLKKDSVLIEVIALPNLNAGPLDSICFGESDYQLNAQPSNLDFYLWSSLDNTLSDVSIPNPTVSPSDNSVYHLFAIDSIGSLACENTDSVEILVHPKPLIDIEFPIAYAGYICQNEGVNLTVNSNDGVFYQWDNSPFLNPLNSAITFATPSDTALFFVNVSNRHNCTSRDSIQVDVQKPISTQIEGDSIMCVGEYVNVSATGGLYYHWYPEEFFTSLFSSNTQAAPDSTTQIFVDISNDCFNDTLYKNILVNQLPYVDAGEDKEIIRDDEPAILDGAGDGQPLWYAIDKSFNGILDLQNTFNPLVSPLNDESYILEVENELTSCKNYDTVKVNVEVITLVALPTGFSPNSDGINESFRSLKFLNIQSVESFRVFNRYGEVVYSDSGFSAAWDGSYKGSESNIGVYTYVLDLITKDQERIIKSGNVTLIGR